MDLGSETNKVLGENTGTLNLEFGVSAPTETCFPLNRNKVPKSLISDSENTCINNACVLTIKEGNTEEEEPKVMLGATLNRDIAAENSFLEALGLRELKELCAERGESGYEECGEENQYLWYNQPQNAVIFSRQLTNLDNENPLDRFLQVIGEFLASFMGLREEGELTPAAEFAQQAQNFRHLYLLKSGEKEVHALVERLLDGNLALLAEFNNFQTPICTYLEKGLPEELKNNLLQAAPGQELIRAFSCTENLEDYSQKVEIVAESAQQNALFLFWPQLTGKLRAE